MRRYHITLGATTTAGGKVISASSNGSINGKKIALEGDAIICPACKSSGKITCVGPRIPETWNGKKVALENDLCICGCALPPKLKPNQSLRCQVIEDPSTQNVQHETGGPAEEAQDVLEQFFSLHDENNHAVEGFRYDLFVNDTIHVAAVGLQDGNTETITGDNQRLTLVTWPTVEEVDPND
ncbi:PAAR domain-containing protein [Duganella phyllosphaerae]|uniref:PAAR motif protein n=1 Tax=Duganella phyllosphaerae TaxID=762836 RepID=A0A1E7X496_9BURK|nr:PAAR domain-containing protein [Duganella phyllosphaerae]OFA07239.1 hypothetical protein DUPY_13470 [Duganella phyllosphaerae]